VRSSDFIAGDALAALGRKFGFPKMPAGAHPKKRKRRR